MGQSSGYIYMNAGIIGIPASHATQPPRIEDNTQSIGSVGGEVSQVGYVHHVQRHGQWQVVLCLVLTQHQTATAFPVAQRVLTRSLCPGDRQISHLGSSRPLSGSGTVPMDFNLQEECQGFVEVGSYSTPGEIDVSSLDPGSVDSTLEGESSA